MGFRDSFSRAFQGLSWKAPEIKPPQQTPEVRAKKERLLNVKGAIYEIPKRAKDRVSEDTALIDEELMLCIVADGVSSGKNGKIASRLAVETLRDEIQQRQGLGNGEVFNEALMEQAMRRASEAIKADIVEHPEHRGMNTTLSAVLIFEVEAEKAYAVVGHVGDSRAYQFQLKSGALLPLTQDDNDIRSYQESGEISADEARAIEQSSQEGRDVVLKNPKLSARRLYSQRAKITKSLVATKENGQRAYNVKTFNVEDGDIIFTVSDGISDVLTEDRILQILREGFAQEKGVSDIFAQMAQEAASDTSLRQKGKEGDDISVAGFGVKRVVAQREREEQMIKEQIEAIRAGLTT
ncbi:MAG: protein phosphatase 2C domain-containing protein [Patescibacteria group bacterium]